MIITFCIVINHYYTAIVLIYNYMIVLYSLFILIMDNVLLQAEKGPKVKRKQINATGRPMQKRTYRCVLTSKMTDDSSAARMLSGEPAYIINMVFDYDPFITRATMLSNFIPCEIFGHHIPVRFPVQGHYNMFVRGLIVTTAVVNTETEGSCSGRMRIEFNASEKHNFLLIDDPVTKWTDGLIVNTISSLPNN